MNREQVKANEQEPISVNSRLKLPLPWLFFAHEISACDNSLPGNGRGPGLGHSPDRERKPVAIHRRFFGFRDSFRETGLPAGQNPLASLLG